MGCGGSKGVQVVAAASQVTAQDAMTPPPGASSSSATPGNDVEQQATSGDTVGEPRPKQAKGEEGSSPNGGGAQEGSQPPAGDDPSRGMSPPRRPEAFDIPLSDSVSPEEAAELADQTRRPPRRLQKLDSVTAPLTSEELKRKQQKVDERRKAELEKKRETGRRHTRRDRFRQEVLQARINCEADGGEATGPASKQAEENRNGAEDMLATGLPSESADEFQVAEVENDEGGSQRWDKEKEAQGDQEEEW